jgi:hypothetical protein
MRNAHTRVRLSIVIFNALALLDQEVARPVHVGQQLDEQPLARDLAPVSELDAVIADRHFVVGLAGAVDRVGHGGLVRQVVVGNELRGPGDSLDLLFGNGDGPGAQHPAVGEYVIERVLDGYSGAALVLQEQSRLDPPQPIVTECLVPAIGSPNEGFQRRLHAHAGTERPAATEGRVTAVADAEEPVLVLKIVEAVWQRVDVVVRRAIDEIVDVAAAEQQAGTLVHRRQSEPRLEPNTLSQPVTLVPLPAHRETAAGYRSFLLDVGRAEEVVDGLGRA